MDHILGNIAASGMRARPFCSFELGVYFGSNLYILVSNNVLSMSRHEMMSFNCSQVDHRFMNNIATDMRVAVLNSCVARDHFGIITSTRPNSNVSSMGHHKDITCMSPKSMNIAATDMRS